MTFFVPPWCAVCGLLFPHPDGRGGRLWAHPSSEAGTGARSVQCHRNNRRLLLRRPDASRRRLRPLDAGGDVLAGADLLMPVPPHCTRPFASSQPLQSVDGHVAGDPWSDGPRVAADWLVRRRRTPTQGTMGRRATTPPARLRCATLAASREGTSCGIDGELTTGATDAECARVLRRAGAAHVVVMVLGRVFKAGA
jgi:predicted amidophosphoribosyltransferase